MSYRIVDAKGRPIPDAVALFGNQSHPSPRAVTDANGVVNLWSHYSSFTHIAVEENYQRWDFQSSEVSHNHLLRLDRARYKGAGSYAVDSKGRERFRPK